MSKWNLIVSVGRCENCNNCVLAERDEHEGNDFPGYAAPADAAADGTICILRRVQGSAPMVDVTYLPAMCNHCDDAPCVRAGGGAVRKRPDGIVIIDPERARGRRDIVASCPYKAIVWNEEQQLPQTWIFDAHLLDQGWDRPRCQQVCPTDVFEAVKLDDRKMAARAEREGLQVLKPQLGTRPRVWYRGLERWQTCFIGGSVCAPLDGLMTCIAEAEVSLFQDGRLLATTLSDGFGDFRFDRLAPGSGDYTVAVRHRFGRAERSCRLGESVYLGEMVLTAEKELVGA
jgi:Fe-S-cluster-containing dehydrogenase component